MQPLPDHTAQHAVTHPLVEKALEMAVIQSIKETLDIRFQHPPTVHLHQPFPELLHRLKRRAARAEAIRAV